MGGLLAKFRKQKTTTQLLENLQENIETLEKYTNNTREQKKRFVGNFLVGSIGIYVVAFAVFYFVYFPPTWKDRILHSIPLMLFPMVIFSLRYLFTWYFQRKLNKNSEKLVALRAEKKKILEQVMDKETYKIAVGLLARFGDTKGKLTPNSTNLSTQIKAPSTLGMLTPQRPQLLPTPISSFGRVSSIGKSPASFNNSTNLPSSPPSDTSGQQLRRRTPFPIVNPSRKSVFERIVDVLIGDGPQDRLAMICKHCYGHNGMALKEDFDYTTFRCVYCDAINPSQKSRPIAPRITMKSMAETTNSAVSSDSSSSLEDDKSDNETIPENAENGSNSSPVSSLSAINKNIETTSTISLLARAAVAAAIPSDEEYKESANKKEHNQRLIKALQQYKQQLMDNKNEIITTTNIEGEQKSGVD